MADDKSHRRVSLKPVAFLAVVLSTAAVAGCLVSFPLIFHYVQTLESVVQVELLFCKARSRDLWKQMLDIQMTGGNHDKLADASLSHVPVSERDAAGPEETLRTKRDAMADFWARRLLDQQLVQSDNFGNRSGSSNGDDSFVQAGSSCCTCQVGAPGPPGPPGPDGTDGIPGRFGMLGAQGPPAPYGPDPRNVFQPQCPCEAPVGARGPKGEPGQPGRTGNDGRQGDDGKSGEPGTPGPAGPLGRSGNPGRTGPQGVPGNLRTAIAPPGRAGAPGRPGPPGRSGKVGEPGKDGESGTPGPKGGRGRPGSPGADGRAGAPGEMGDPGEAGQCSHCPPARLAPGY